MGDDKQIYTIIMRHDTSTQWAINNPVLAFGEYAVEDDTHRVKRGDGETEWNDLLYEDFGLVYLITYDNLAGEVSDNEKLQEALDKKMSLNVFEDVNYQTVSSIDITGEEGIIGRITKVSKNIDTAVSDSEIIKIVSSDDSIKGYWAVDNRGVRILNLEATYASKTQSSLNDFIGGHQYYKNQMCYYKNTLYRARADFYSTEQFDINNWGIVASLDSENLYYDNTLSELDSDTVKMAIDELKRRNDNKISKSTESRIVYGTTQTGAQILIPIDDLRTVDTVNGIAPTNPETKNIQIDASNINYDDTAETPETVKEKLDQKVDVTVAGVGAKIVRDIRFNYNTTTGHITLIEDKFSLEDGTSVLEETEIDVVSEAELISVAQTIDTRINTEVSTLNNTITTKETAIYSRIQDEHDNINQRVTNEVDTLNAKIDTQTSRLDARIDVAVEDYTSKINNLATAVVNNKTDIEGKLANAVNTLNNTIDTEIATESTNLHTYIDAQDGLKIDKNIADSIVTLLDVATHDRQPTIRITNKNTNSKQTTYDYVHFTTIGNITVSVEDADHIVIDSTDIDTIDTQQNTRLTNAENRLNAHDTSIASLLEHDVNHDRTLATHTSQIANQETRILALEDDVDDLETALDNEVTNRTTADANLSTRIADNAVRIANNTQAIRDNADSIDNLAQTVAENIEALANNKVNKDFASDTNNKVVGQITSGTIANNELVNLTKTMVSPIDGSSTTETIKIISSDNTVIATRRNDGTIDLATNLDTDVNYFVTTEIISTTIASETTLDMTKLTPTDKVDVELQDIITDPEGTWGRVKSINTQNDTCVVVTFKKHAQAVWGTVKGTLSDQQDLQTELDKKIESVNGHSTTAQSKAITIDGSDINIDETAQTKVTIKNALENLISDLQNQIKSYTQDTQYVVSGNYTSQNYVTIETENDNVLMAKVLRGFTSNNTESTVFESFIYDVEHNNLKLIGIPEEVSTGV